MTVEGKQTNKGLSAVPRDRYAELLVIIIIAAALVVAWGVKAGAEARAVQIEIEGFRASYGHNWIREEPIAPDILKIVDPGSGARFRTTISVRALQDAADAKGAARSLHQGRLLEKKMYQSLGTYDVQVRGRDLVRNEFAYVYASPDLLHPTVPVVVHGVDYVLPQGDTSYVITLVADDSVYDEAMIEFERFLDSVSPG